MLTPIALGVILACTMQLYAALTPADFEITSLPGLNDPINFQHYSGYITFNKTHGRNMFFWFATSPTPAESPFVVWLNGGPGCSSLGGLFSEMGPYFPTANENAAGQPSLQLNPYAWNQVANMLFLESPSGVGFSYSDTKSDYYTGDYQTAQDSVEFLADFFAIFTEFANHTLYIAGESYGGHYVPNLANALYQSNLEGKRMFFNIQGFAAGNPWTVAPIDNQGAAFYWWSHALNTLDTYNGIVANCNFSFIGPLFDADETKGVNNQLCNKYCDIAMQQMGNINIYDIYNDVCLSNQEKQLLKHLAGASTPFARIAQNRLGSSVNNITLDACVEEHMATYLNFPEVQAAIHAIPTNWVQCSTILHYSREDLLTSMFPVYEQLLATDLRKLIYSGDVDAIVPYTGTRTWIYDLNLTTLADWTPWLDLTNQTGGYVTKFSHDLTFATVRQAGHMAPYTQPLRALQLFTAFLNDEL